jgi:hypothetical protein
LDWKKSVKALRTSFPDQLEVAMARSDARGLTMGLVQLAAKGSGIYPRSNTAPGRGAGLTVGARRATCCQKPSTKKTQHVAPL